jgi:hypothetical protein
LHSSSSISRNKTETQVEVQVEESQRFVWKTEEELLSWKTIQSMNEMDLQKQQNQNDRYEVGSFTIGFFFLRPCFVWFFYVHNLLLIFAYF